MLKQHTEVSTPGAEILFRLYIKGGGAVLIKASLG